MLLCGCFVGKQFCSICVTSDGVVTVPLRCVCVCVCVCVCRERERGGE